MRSKQVLLRTGLALAGLLLAGRPSAAASLKLLLPLGRTAYQTNEQIDVSVVLQRRAGVARRRPGSHVVGRRRQPNVVRLPGGPAAAGSHGAAATEHLHFNGWLLRPGHYTLSVYGPRGDGLRGIGCL